MAQLRRFFFWLADQPGYKSKLNYSDSDYFNLSEKDGRIATARRPRPVPTLEQIHRVLSVMPTDTTLELRDRAVIAFALLTGARDSAIASIKIKHLDLLAGSVYQDAKEVRTKFSKSFTTWFFPVGGRALLIFQDWVNHLQAVHLWGNGDPVFPATLTALDPTGQWHAAGIQRTHWSSAAPIRSIFKAAFKAAGLPYFNPHSVRNTLVGLGQALCGTPEEFKAWSQNLGHEQVLTTFTSYGTVPCERQAEIIGSLSAGGIRGPVAQPTNAEILEAINKLRRT